MATILFNPIGPPFDFSVTGGASGPVDTLTGNDDIVVSPIGNNINVVGTGGVNVTGNNSDATLTIAFTNILTVTPVAGPVTYTVLPADQFLAVNVTGGAVIIKLPNAPSTGRIYYIKDSNGEASGTNISITTVGGTVMIDEETTYTIAGNFDSLAVIFDGTNYEIF